MQGRLSAQTILQNISARPWPFGRPTKIDPLVTHEDWPNLKVTLPKEKFMEKELASRTARQTDDWEYPGQRKSCKNVIVVAKVLRDTLG
jgi:hypothetical protein